MSFKSLHTLQIKQIDSCIKLQQIAKVMFCPFKKKCLVNVDQTISVWQLRTSMRINLSLQWPFVKQSGSGGKINKGH